MGKKERKLSVLIVDDEEIVRQDLRTLINWEEQGYRIAAEASGAAEALEVLQHLQVQIIITDIEMPGMNGLTFAAEALKLDPKIKILVLTAYNDFDYVRGSVRLGAISYILKHELDERMLLDELKRSREKIENEERLDFSRYSDLMGTFLHSRGGRSEKYAFAQNNKIPAVDERSCLLKVYLPEEENGAPAVKAHASLIEEALAEVRGLRCMVFSREEGAISILIAVEDSDREAVREKALQEIRRLFKAAGRQVYLLIGEWINDISQMRVYYDRMKVHADLPYLYPEPAEIKLTYDEFSRSKSRYLELSLTRALSEKRYGEAQSALEALLIQLPDTLDSVFIRECTGGLAEALTEQLPSQIRNQRTELSTYRQAMAGTYPEQCTYLRNLLDLVHRDHMEQNGDRVGMISTYITRHYDEDISLESLAAMFHVSEAYMGQIFKGYMGMPFKNYLRMVRMEKAGQLLLSSKYKLQVVASKTGYSSTAYFCTVFKQYFHMTPTEFVESRSKS